jgi:hypothetical protein
MDLPFIRREVAKAKERNQIKISLCTLSTPFIKNFSSVKCDCKKNEKNFLAQM